MNPSGPCFVTGPKGYFSFEATYTSEQKATLLAALGDYFEKSTVYDAEGKKWVANGVECKYAKSWWLLALANLCYNPYVTVRVTWRKPQPYVLEELRKKYLLAVDKDDDILTQFVEADELKERIASVSSFSELVAVYNWMETDHTNTTKRPNHSTATKPARTDL